jgi:hypothetical protein
MTLKISFEPSSFRKSLCLGVFEDQGFLPSTEAWDKKLSGFLRQSIENSKFKGSLNQSLTLFSPDGTQLILIGLGKRTDQNEMHWQKIGGFLIATLAASSTEEGAT